MTAAEMRQRSAITTLIVDLPAGVTSNQFSRVCGHPPRRPNSCRHWLEMERCQATQTAVKWTRRQTNDAPPPPVTLAAALQSAHCVVLRGLPRSIMDPYYERPSRFEETGARRGRRGGGGDPTPTRLDCHCRRVGGRLSTDFRSSVEPVPVPVCLNRYQSRFE